MHANWTADLADDDVRSAVVSISVVQGQTKPVSAALASQSHLLCTMQHSVINSQHWLTSRLTHSVV